MSANPVEPENFPVFASEVCPPYTYKVAFGIVPSVAAVDVDVLLVVGEPAAGVVFALIDKRYPKCRYVHFQSSLNHYTAKRSRLSTYNVLLDTHKYVAVQFLIDGRLR